jgi:TPR repeat protein
MMHSQGTPAQRRALPASGALAVAMVAAATIPAQAAPEAPPEPLPATLAAALAPAERRAAQGDWRAQELLGLVYVSAALAQQGPVAPDTGAAPALRGLAWLTAAAEQGSPAARQVLAALYAQGQLVARDERAAARWRSEGTLDDAGCR